MAISSERVQQLLTRFENFNGELMSFVETCSDENWQKVTSAEQWPVGVVARHIATGHYSVIGWIRLIIADQPLPPMTMKAIHQMNAEHAKAHASCTQAEVLQLLQKHGKKIASVISGLNDDILDKKTYFDAFKVEMSVEQTIKNVMIRVPKGHLESMNATVGA